MSGSTALYAAKKRKKPVQKIPKPSLPDGTKSNPSKRHRDRLNGELDKLTSLLPFSEDVCARLDKLSVLRLSVGYLKVKSFFNATMKKSSPGWGVERAVGFGGNGRNALTKTKTSVDGVTFSEGDLLLQALNGFVMVVTAEGYVFYSSSTVQEYLGFHQSDVVHQSVFELIHTDDRALFRRQLHFALNPNQLDAESETTDGLQPTNSSDITNNIVTYDPQHIPPENSSFLERSFVCRFRCLLDNSSGFLALNFHGRLKYLHGQNKMSDDGTMGHPQLALFVVASPLQTPSILEIRTKTLLFQTKHKLDFTPMGVDARGKVVLGYSEIELCMRGSGYQFIHAADMMYCADNHVRMIKTGESGLTVFRLLTKNSVWVWVQANARLVYKGGRPDFIVARQRPLSNEEGEEQLRLRRLQLPFNFATGEAVLYEVGPCVDVADVPSQSRAPKIRKMVEEMALDPSSLLGSMLKQDQTMYTQPSPVEPSNPLELCSWEDEAFRDSHALSNVPVDAWQSQHPSMPKPGAGVKEEAAVQDMVQTLQQIIGDNQICSSLDVDPTELKDWENTLLKMNSSSCEMSEDLDDIFNQDILSYVEEQLLKENGGFKMDSLLGCTSVDNALLDGQECLANMNLGNNMSGGDWAVDPGQSQFLRPGGMQGLSLAEEGGNMLGMMKLTHTGPQTGQNGPVLQKPSNNTFAQPLVNHPSQQSNANPVTFNTALGNSCAQLRQNQVQSRQGLQTLAGPGNGLVSCSITQQGYQNQGQLSRLGMTDQLMRFQDPSSIIQSNIFALPDQETLWMPSAMANSNMVTDELLETFAQTISNQQQDNVIRDPNPLSCLQGHVSLHTQNSLNQNSRNPSRQQNQQLPTTLLQQNGPRQNVMGSCYNVQVSDFQRAPQLPISGLPAQHSQGQNTSGAQTLTVGLYKHQKAPGMGMSYPPLGHREELIAQALMPSNSCMFSNTKAHLAPVNGVHFTPNPALGSLVPHSNGPLQDQSSSQASCYFQRGSGGPIAGTTTIQQDNTTTSPLSRHMDPVSNSGGLVPDSRLVQQQYLNCNGQQTQTQIPNPPLGEDESYPLQHLPNGTAYFSGNNQTNCYDF
ncbi:hypothetical protein DPEC_G00150350 [Dallia pectoralis]|uniref:Uncharacterized protein n=1 Tax=Dallia pectoralis TaxID=75939 RepID=A0ACC2GJ43_DALPE|nr:hypothetical protein DPEC_G00150350 [Dallia pectoralis]